MNYKIIGIDGKTYGPTTAEQIRQWIVQGRIESQTPVFVDGASEWTFIGLLPEFSKHFPGTTPPVVAPPKPVVMPSSKTNGFATAGFVCGIASLPMFCCCGFPFNLLGLIFSIIALVQIKAAVEKPEGRGLAIAGLVCSAVSLLLSFGFVILQIVTSPARGVWHLGEF
jgi:hypothetical protein